MKPPAIWILQTTHSHLYPGALLRYEADVDPTAWRAGDAVVIAFSDLSTGHGQLSAPAAAAPSDWLLDLAARQTAHGSNIQRQCWRLQQAHQPPNTLRVLRPTPHP